MDTSDERKQTPSMFIPYVGDQPQKTRRIWTNAMNSFFIFTEVSKQENIQYFAVCTGWLKNST